MNFVFFSLAVTGVGISGGDRIFIELARNWSRKHKITIYTSFQGARLIKNQKLFSKKTVIKTIPNKSFSKVFIVDYIYKVVYSIYLGLTISANKETSIYSSSEFLMDVIPASLMKLRQRKLKWIATWYQTAPNPLKGFAESNREKRYNFKALLYFLSQLPTKPLISSFADKVVVNNIDEKRRFPKKETIVLIGAVPLQLIKEFRKRHKNIKKLYDSVFQGRFHAQKGVEELISIWRNVVDEKPNARLAMIGDGPLMQNVKLKIKNFKLNKNVKLFGYLFDGDKKFNVFAQSKTVVHPAFYDSGGMASAEAMAFGLPVVGFDLFSYKSYYPRGMLKVKQNDLDAFSEAILRLLESKKLYSKYSDEAINLIESNYSWEKRAEEILKEIKN